MPSPSVFQILTATPIGLATLRITFSKAPKATDPLTTNDALNFANYVISGPNTITVFDVVTVDAQPLQLDLLLSDTLSIGNWTISASNIVTTNLAETIYSGAVAFAVTQEYVQDALSPGTLNDTGYGVLRKFFHPALRGPGWDSILTALGLSDEQNWNNSQLAFNQYYLSTASGSYLNKRAAERGQVNPENVGLTDDLFRKLAITTTTRGLNQESILEVLEVFYGIDATQAFTESTASEPFALKDGDELDVLIDEKVLIRVPFSRMHYANIATATANEVAAEITRTATLLGSNAYAINDSGQVKIYSGSRGLSSSVRIVGGRAQIALLFPTRLFTTVFSSVTWNISLSPITGNLRFTESTGTYFDLSKVQTGDYVYIYGSEFAVANTNGAFQIQSVSVSYSGAILIQWFEITNPIGVAASGVVQSSQLDLDFFRPIKSTIYSNLRHVVVGSGPGYLDVIIPATTQAVNRKPGIAAYLNNGNITQISSLSRDATGLVTVNTTTNHGLSPGNQVILDSIIPAGTASPITNGTPSGAFSGNTASGTTNASIQTTVSASNTVAAVNHQVLRLPMGQLMVVGGFNQITPSHVANTNPVVFEVTSSATLANGGRQDSYTWKNISSITFTIGPYAFGSSVLQSGLVLLTGGQNIPGSPQNNFDLISYSDSASSIFSGTMPVALTEHGQCSRSSGNAIIAGGWTSTSTPTNGSYIFSGSTFTWSTAANINLARNRPQMIETPNIPNNVLLVGGFTDSADSIPTNKCELYSTTGNTWTFTGSMSYARALFGMISLPDGRILVVGGIGNNPSQSSSTSILNSCEIYDPNSQLWGPIGSLALPRLSPSVFYNPTTNSVYVIGGAISNALSGTTGIVDILDLKTMKWRQSIISQTFNSLYDGVGNYAATDTLVWVGGATSGSAITATDFIIVPGSESKWSGGLNTIATVIATPLSNQFTYQTDIYNKYDKFVAATTGTVTAMAAQPSLPGIPGPFSYDTKNGLSVSPETSGQLNMTLYQGAQYNSIQLNTSPNPEPALEFPDAEGYIVINYGYANQVGPIKYFGRFSETAIRIDPGFKFPSVQNVGSMIYLLNGKSPFIPPKNQLLGNFYVTGSAVGRIAAEDNVNKITAAGTDVLITVQYPSDKGLGAEGFPTTGDGKLSDIVEVFGGDNVQPALGSTTG